MYVDFKDLSKASPKDIHLLHIDFVLYNTIDDAILSFVDGYDSYNQVKMAEKDKKTTFIFPQERYYYTVKPFELKKARVAF